MEMKGHTDISRWLLLLCFKGLWGGCAGLFFFYGCCVLSCELKNAINRFRLMC